MVHIKIESLLLWFLVYISSLLNLFLMILLTFSKMCKYFIRAFSSLVKKINVSIFIKISLIYNNLWTECVHRPNFFRIVVTNEIFKILFTKTKLIRYYYFINIYIVYRNRAFMLIEFSLFSFSVIK